MTKLVTISGKEMCKLLEKLGFEIEAINDETQAGQVVMSREKLLELYGNNNQMSYEIIEKLKKEIAGYQDDTHFEHVGLVTEVGDGIAKISGLSLEAAMV